MSLAVLADHMASKGRGPDSMLIHMSPREVQGLQALAENHGGSLTINPETGLPEAGILDKLLPAIIGFALAPMTAGTSLAFLGATPMASALTVGGLQALRTGDIGKGIQAGLGAYGGAGLQAGLATAGGNILSGEATALAANEAGKLAGEEAVRAGVQQGLSEETINQLRMQAIEEAGNATARVATNASPFEKLSAGFDAAKANPSSLLTKDNFKYAAAAAGPILADQAVTSKLPVTATKPGYIRPYSFDPYGGTYTAGTPYEAMPTRAAGGGLMGMAAGGMAGYEDDEEGMATGGMGGMFNFAQQSEPVVRMAEGGIAHFVLGGEVKGALEAAYAANDTAKINDIVAQNKITAEDVGSTWKGFDTSGIAGLNLYTPPAAVDTADAGGGGGGAPAYTQYSDEQIGDWFAQNKNATDAQVKQAIIDSKIDPNAVNKYLASTAGGFTGSSWDKGGSGTLGIYNQWNALGISPDEYYAAALANDPKYAGWTKDMITEAYDLSKGAYALTDQIAKDKIAADPVFGYDKQWVKFMDDNKYDANDMAQALGLSIKDVTNRYNAVKAAEKKTDTKYVNLGGTGTTTGTTTGTGGTGTGGTGGVSLETATKLPPGVSGAGVTTVNPNGTITTRPDFSLQMKDVRDTYEKGGGSLGVNKNLFVPKTQDELFARYKNTGGSKAALDYLMGKTTYSPTPYTPTGEIQKPYWESVGLFPAQEGNRNKKYVFVNGKYELNPGYVKPSYVLAGEKAAALSNQDKEPVDNPGAGKKWVWNSVDKKWEAQDIGGDNAAAISENDRIQGGGGGDANGGLMAGGGLAALTMAGGGMSGQFDLGGYSDGGRLLRGPGDGVSDSIPATIGGKRPARLADGEFVVPARIVSELGNGSTEAGARKLYAMMDRVQKARRGTVGKGKVAKNSRSDKYLPA